MYNIINNKPKFIVMDIVKIIKTGELAIITETNQNIYQSEDDSQWSWAIHPLNKNSESRHAWYNMNELELINNVFEIVAKRMSSNLSFKFLLDEMRR